MPESSTAPGLAVLRITRTLIHDDHAGAGGTPPDIDNDTQRIVFDDGARAPAERAVVRRYAATIAVPAAHPRSWDLAMGDDYRLLVTTRGFIAHASGLRIDGQVVSNYQVQLADDRPGVGPNAFRFAPQAVGERVLVQVLADEAPGQVFREYDETVVEQQGGDPPAGTVPGIDESAEAQQRRREAWTPLRKRSLR